MMVIIMTLNANLKLPEAASFGELNIIATSWAGTDEAIRMADPKNFGAKL
jgi:hypothetical protein